MKHMLLISKDATLPEYFEPYGGRYWSTPNINELASKGTVFLRHYTAAPSTAMAFTAMFTGLYPYQTPRKNYSEVNDENIPTLFDSLHDLGYECHIIWSSNYIKMAEKFSKCYGRSTIHHDKLKFNQSCGFNVPISKEDRSIDDDLARNTIEEIYREASSINFSSKPVFLWVHMPHCIIGRRCYGGDIDLFDELIGRLRTLFDDDSIYITADHGHMNGAKGKIGYGFDVYEPEIEIPLITPRIEGMNEIDFPTSNTQLSEIILKKTVTRKPYVMSDSMYYAQPNRKLAIIIGSAKYIFNKKTRKIELYNLNYDPNEQDDLMSNYIYDIDRKCRVDKRQVILNPDREQVVQKLSTFESIRSKMWREATLSETLAIKRNNAEIIIKQHAKRVLRKLITIKNR